MSKFDGVLIIVALFSFLSTLYGISTSSNISDGTINAYMNIIFGPWPSVNFPILQTNCAPLDLVCVAKVANAAAAYPGLAIFYIANLVFSALTRVSAFGSMIQTILFGGFFASGGVPYLSVMMAIFILIGAIEVFRIARGSASGV